MSLYLPVCREELTKDILNKELLLTKQKLSAQHEQMIGLDTKLNSSLVVSLILAGDNSLCKELTGSTD